MWHRCGYSNTGATFMGLLGVRPDMAGSPALSPGAPLQPPGGAGQGGSNVLLDVPNSMPAVKTCVWSAESRNRALSAVIVVARLPITIWVASPPSVAPLRLSANSGILVPDGVAAVSVVASFTISIHRSLSLTTRNGSSLVNSSHRPSGPA